MHVTYRRFDVQISLHRGGPPLPLNDYPWCRAGVSPLSIQFTQLAEAKEDQHNHP